MPASIMSPLSISPRKRSAHSRRHRVSQSRCAEGTGVGVRLFVVEAGLHVRHFGRTATQAKYAATILAKVPIKVCASPARSMRFRLGAGVFSWLRIATSGQLSVHKLSTR